MIPDRMKAERGPNYDDLFQVQAQLEREHGVRIMNVDGDGGFVVVMDNIAQPAREKILAALTCWGYTTI